MDQPLHHHMRLGVVLCAAFPNAAHDAGMLQRAVECIASDDFFTAVEIRYVSDAGARARMIDVLRASRLTVVYEAHPLLHGHNLDLNSADDAQRLRAVDMTRRAVEEAKAVGAERLNVVSGADAGPQGRDRACDALVDSLCAVADYATEIDGPSIALEPYSPDHGYTPLLGRAHDALALLRLVREMYPSVGLTLDTGHMALLHEDTGAVLSLVAPYLGQLHLANAIPGTGTTAPPFGVFGGVYDMHRLSDLLLTLFRVGFLGAGRRPLVCLRVTPGAGEQPEWVLAGAKRTLTEAWMRL